MDHCHRTSTILLQRQQRSWNVQAFQHGSNRASRNQRELKGFCWREEYFRNFPKCFRLDLLITIYIFYIFNLTGVRIRRSPLQVRSGHCFLGTRACLWKVCSFHGTTLTEVLAETEIFVCNDLILILFIQAFPRLQSHNHEWIHLWSVQKPGSNGPHHWRSGRQSRQEWRYVFTFAARFLLAVSVNCD